MMVHLILSQSSVFRIIFTVGPEFVFCWFDAKKLRIFAIPTSHAYDMNSEKLTELDFVKK